MVWHIPANCRCAVPSRLMAPIAIGVRRRQVVVVSYVAIRAGIHFAYWHQLVRANKWPTRRGMVEYCRQERYCVVTVRAVRRRERCSCRGMHRVGGSLPAPSVVRIQVALRVPAVGRLDLQIVVIVDVAVGARSNLARRRQLVGIG